MNNRNGNVVLRTLFFSFLIVSLTFTTLMAGSLLTGEVSPKTYPQGIPSGENTLRAITVRTGAEGDFPSAPQISAKAQREQLDQIASFAGTYGFNAVFFEAVPDGAAFYRSALLPTSAYWTGEQGNFAFFDPLGHLTDICREKNIQVYAVVDPFTVSDGGLAKTAPANRNPKWTTDGFLDPANEEVRALAADVVKELTKNYDIAGVILSGVDSDRFQSVEDYPRQLAALGAQARKALRDKKQQRLGMVVRPIESGIAETAAENADFLVTTGAPDPVAEQAAFMEQLAGWQALCQKNNIPFYPLHTSSEKNFTAHTAENAAWQESRYGAGGTVVSGYKALNTGNRLAAISLAASFREQPDPNMPDFSYPNTFAVTRPTETLYLDYTWESYFVTGTAAPGLTVLANGEEIEPVNGLWGHLVSLAYGTNKFTFSQNGVSQTVTIVRNEPVSGPITAIRASSAYPGNPEVVLEGRALKLSCTAPAGSTVTASLGGLSATLQPASAGKNGDPVTYQGQLNVSSLGSAGQVTEAGPVTYRLSYDGGQSSQQSAGSVYVAGTGSTPVARMKLFGTMVNANAADDGEYATILRQGCVDVITDNAGGYYGLSMGGYILKSAVEIEAGPASAVSQVSGVTLQKTDKGEKLVISGTRRPSYKGTLTEDALTVNVRNLSGWPSGNLSSTLCSVIDAQQNNDGSVTITFRFNPDARIAGWDVLFDEGTNDMSIYLRQKPAIDWNSATPLSGVSIALDPGHGGSDPGAMGVPGTSGPAENLLNLANSYALRSRLTAMGADVRILQENTDSSLDQRLALSQKYDADLFISSHHNSLSETVDSNGVTGVEIYYWNDWSGGFAQNIGENLSAQTGRKLRAVTQSWYRVTMMYACPAVLVESGFVSNPAEYGNLANEYAMYRYANAVTDAVLQYLTES